MDDKGEMFDYHREMTGEPSNGKPFKLVRRHWEGYD